MDVNHCRERLNFIENGNLTEDDNSIEQPQNLGLTLKPHQLIMVYAMRKLETTPIELKDTKCTMKTTMGVLADAVGSGKTYDCLACISECPIIENNPTYIQQYGLKTIQVESLRRLSNESINLIVNRANGERINLNNELEKIESYVTNKKQISVEEIYSLTNLSENYSINELVDNCLAKNKQKTIYILNENNFSFEDTIIIIRTFLIKSKRLLKLSENFKDNKNLDKTILNFKPPIFWKDKDLVKQQIKNWSLNKTYELIDEINKIELDIKKNSSNSINILLDFILNTSKTNN